MSTQVGGFYSRAQLQEIAEMVLGKRAAGQSDQGVYEQSSVQKFEIGTPRIIGNIIKRKFRYSKAVVALAGYRRLVINTNICPGATGHENEDGFEGAIGYAAEIGATYLDVADTELRAANYYKGGMAVIYGTTLFHEYEIIGSDAGNGVKVRVYLKNPVAVEAIGLTDGCTLYLNPYCAIAPTGTVGAGFEWFAGVNLIPVTINYFFWLQTGGPAIITPTGGTWPGAAVNLRDVYANNSDGTIQPASLSDPTAGYQRIGSLLSATVNTYGDLWVNLDLDPV